MNELENEGVYDDNEEYEEVEQDEIEEVEEDDSEPSESATDSEGEHEEQRQESRINQDKVNARIAQKHREAREAQERAKQLEAELQQYRQQQQEQAPQVPAMPDPFDDDYEDKIRQRDEALRKRAQWEAKQEVAKEYQRQQQEYAQRQQQQELQKQLNDFVQRGAKLGVKNQELFQAGQKVSEYGLDKSVEAALLTDADGPLLLKYMAGNPYECMEIASMAPYEAAMYIHEHVRPKAKALKPKQSSAPKPSTKVSGSGKADSGLKHAKGGTFS